MLCFESKPKGLFCGITPLSRLGRLTAFALSLPDEAAATIDYDHLTRNEWRVACEKPYGARYI